MAQLYYSQNTPWQHIEVRADGPGDRKIRIEGRTENFLTPEDAVELARGLLQAVERAWTIKVVRAQTVAKKEAKDAQA